MTHEQREAYIKQAKQTFHSNTVSKNSIKNNYSNNASYSFDQSDEQDHHIGSYWKTRLVIAVVIFAIIFSVHETSSAKSLITHEQIASLIEKNVDMETVQTWFSQ